jgi:hypothetical protein
MQSYNSTYCYVCLSSETGGHCKEREELQMLGNNLFREADLSRTEIRGKVLAVVYFCYVIYVQAAMAWTCSVDER